MCCRRPRADSPRPPHRCRCLPLSARRRPLPARPSDAVANEQRREETARRESAARQHPPYRRASSEICPTHALGSCPQASLRLPVPACCCDIRQTSKIDQSVFAISASPSLPTSTGRPPSVHSPSSTCTVCEFLTLPCFPVRFLLPPLSLFASFVLLPACLPVVASRCSS